MNVDAAPAMREPVPRPEPSERSAPQPAEPLAPTLEGPRTPPGAFGPALVPPPAPAAPGPNGAAPGPAGCTAPQLRRFIKSRPYVPMHELRRRFGINGHEDDVSPIDLGDRRLFVGLPPREGSLVGELLRGGDIGYELSLDPRTPIVVGLYPMRPVARS
ncbi:MAG TPA: hypothetical protein VFJ71_05495 [Candidatus Limnocylindrales bacterium]|nr:hypothetical protein [Candidatus Limnocylindrales bacterium]